MNSCKTNYQIQNFIVERPKPHQRRNLSEKDNYSTQDERSQYKAFNTLQSSHD